MTGPPRDAKSAILAYHPRRTSYQDHPKAEFFVFVDLDSYDKWRDGKGAGSG